jgi:glycosyltransferase involved in cell wall biosynthesis
LKIKTATAADVTAIITVKNGVETIVNAIESVLAQTPRGKPLFQVLVIDGQSTDGTIDQIRHYPDIQILNQQSKGLAGARNEALAEVKTPLVAFCDADDVWTPGSLQKKLDHMVKVPSSWAISGQVHFEATATSNSGLPARRLSGTEHRGVTPGAMLIKRSAFDAVGRFDETLKIGSDADWIVRAVQALGPQDFIDMVVLNKGIRAGSLSTDIETYRSELQLIARRFIERSRGDIKK